MCSHLMCSALKAFSPQKTIRMPDYLEFDPAQLAEPDIYRLLIGGVVPRPIGWASTLSANGVANLAPFSFFTPWCA